MHDVHATVSAVSIWRSIGDWLLGPAASMPAPQLLTWMSPQDSVQTVFIPDDLKAHLADAKQSILDHAAAMKVPAYKRSFEVVCGVLSRMPWVQYAAGGQRLAEQPSWLVSSKSGVSPRHLRWGVAADQFAHGIAAIGFKLDAAGGYPVDAMHLPFGTMWRLDGDKIRVSTAIPAEYRQRVVVIPLGYGTNGMLIDAADTIRDAQDIAAAYRDRIKNPIPQTDLELTGERWDAWSKEEREEFRQLWIAGRKAENGATAMRPEWVKPNYSGEVPANLFESGRNANRLDMANHAGLPASMVEGVRQGGGGGGTEMRYSGVANGAGRNELWDYGLDKYASSWEGRLSLDDVCPPGEYIRVDTSRFLAAPNPTDPEASED